MSAEEVKQRLLEGIEELRNPEGYLNAGYPRYNTLFGRDSLVSAWQMLKIDPSIAKATLQTLSKYQGKNVNPKADEEPGKILHELRYNPKGRKRGEMPNWDFPYYGSVDSTSLFVIVAGEYCRQTGDKSCLSEIWANILAAFEWIRLYGDKDGDAYVEYERGRPSGLFHQGWKDGIKDHLGIEPPVAIVEVQGYAYAAYRTLVFLERELDKNDISEEVLTRSEVLRKAFNKSFWMKKEDYFALALDSRKEQHRAITSNPGHLLFTGIMDEEKVEPLVSRLFQTDLWTPYGVRNHSAWESDFDPYSYHKGSVWPHDNWIIYKGLRNQGFGVHANKIKEALLSAFRELGRIPELYAVVNGRIVDLSRKEGVWANPLQAWSLAGLLEMIWED